MISGNATRLFVRVAAETWVPWARVYTTDEGKIGLDGPMGEMLKIFADAIDFDYEILRPPDGLWGAIKADGNWSGMIGMLQREEAEFAMGPFTITPQRETMCDFALPIHNDNKAILTVRPGLQNDVSGFLKPFTALVWSLIMLSVCCVTVALTTIVWLEAKISGRSTTRLSLKSVKWIFITAQDSRDWTPRLHGARLVAMIWMLSAFVFMSSYSGILTAMLTLPRVNIPIDSLEDLVAQSKLPWRLEQGSMATQYLMESADPVRREVVARSSGYFYDCWKSKEDIATGKFAGICDETTMKKAMSWDFSSTGKCHLYMTREKVISGTMMGIAFKRNSTLLPRANEVIHHVKQSGILIKWLNDQITNTTECLKPPSADRTEGIRALNLETFSGPFIFIGGGLFISFMVFVGEQILYLITKQCCGESDKETPSPY